MFREEEGKECSGEVMAREALGMEMKRRGVVRLEGS